MAGEHRAGTVVVRITADTKGFRRQVEEAARGIGDLEANVAFNPDTARLERAYREWNGKDATVHLDFKPDTRNLDPWMKRFEKQEENLRRGLSLKPKLDSTGLNRGLSEFNSRTDRAVRENGLLNSKLVERNLDRTVKAFDKKGRELSGTSFFKRSALPKADEISFATSLDKTVDAYREKKMDLFKQVRGLVKGNENLTDEQAGQFEKLSNRIVKTRSAIRGLKGDLAKATQEVDALDAKRLEAKANKQPTSDLWKQEREAAKRVTAVNKAIAAQEKELGKLRSAQDSLIDIATESDAKRVSKLTRQVRALEESIVTAGDSLSNFSKARHTALDDRSKAKTYKDMFDNLSVMHSSFVKELEAERAQAEREAADSAIDFVRKPITQSDVAKTQFEASRHEAEELIDTYRNVRKELESDVAAMKRNNKDWFDLDEYKQTVKALDDIDARIEKLKKSPVTDATRLEDSDFQKRLADLYSRNGVRNREDIRLRFVAENLNEVRSKIEAFKRQGVDVPVTLKAQLREMYRQLAYYQRLLKDNPKARVKVDVEGNFARLNREIEKWSKKRVKVEFYTEGANRIYREMRELVRSGVEVPVEYVAKFRNLEKQWRDYAAKLERDPNAKLPAKLHLDTNEAEKDLRKFKDQQVSVRFYEDGADAIRRTLRELEHKRLDVPVSLKAEYSQVESEMRRYAELLKSNPDAELPAKLHIDKKHAEEELKKFQDKNDTLNMDVDLETALARAHLAYFTRPRTIDIFAKFHGTDIGKILNGMTYGATGLKGVENQFQKLVNLMDTLDSKVPKFALLGGVLTSLGAGATNLAGSVGGVGKSLISLSKAAYAAPAALTGLLGVFASFKMIYGDKGETWSNQIDFANTKLSQLSQSVQDAFYGQAKPAIMDTANAIGDSLVPEMRTLAKHEGEIVAGMMDAVRTSYKMNELPQTFDYVNESLDNLVPGVNSLITALSKVGAAGGKYLPQFANWVSRNATLFAEWGDAVLKDSDRVDNAMAEVKEQAGYLGSSVKSLKDIFEGTFGTLAYYENGIEGMATTLAKMDRAVNSVKFQQSMKYWIDGAQTAQSEVRAAFSQVGDSAYSLRNVVKVAFVDAGAVVSSTLSNVSRLLGDSRTGITDFVNGLANGWEKAMAEIGNSGPVFSELLSMVGSLSNAFGGTFAASLKAAAPLIKTIAEAAGSLADEFDKLPAPIKGALGLWMTFGRAGKAAWTSLKTGALENIQSTIQYQNTLRQLGMTADSTKVKFTQLLAAMAQLERNNKVANATGEAAVYGNIAGVFSGVSKEAEHTSESVEKAGKALEGAGSKAGSFKTKASSALGKVGSVASDLTTVVGGLVGGWAGLAGMAGIGALTAAYADYAQHAQNVEQVSQSVAEAIQNVASVSTDAASNLGNIGQAVEKQFRTNADAGLTKWGASFIGKAFGSTVMTGTFQDMSDVIGTANKYLGKNKVSLDEVSKTVVGTDKEFNKFNSTLNKTFESHRKNNSINREEQTAYSNLSQRMTEVRKQTEEQLRETAVQNGYDKSYVDTLLKKGDSLEDIAVMTQSATQLEENHANAEKMLSEAATKTKSSLIALNSAGSSYNATLASMGDVCKDVQTLMSQGQNAWDSQKQNFDLTTEAGREASNAFSTLSSNAQSYISAMIDHGDSLDTVTAKNNEMRQSIYDTAMQMFNNKDIAKALQDQYALTPSEVETEFKAHVQQAKLDCMTYLNLLRDEFIGDGKQKEYDIIMKAITSGAITDINQVQTAVDAVLGGASARDVTILLQAKDGASDKIKNAKSLAESFGLTKTDIQILATDEAGPKLDEVKKKLKDKGLTDAQIQILIDALDKASDKMNDIEKKKVPAAKGVKFNIDANDDDANVKLAKYQNLDGSTVATAHTYVIGDDSSAQSTFDNTKTYDGVTIARPWGRVMGEHVLATLAFAAIEAFNGVTIARPWGRVMGDNDDARRAFRETRVYDGVTLAHPWGRVRGDDSDVQNVFRRIAKTDGSVLATRYVDVVTRKSGDGSVTAATGGRISGPGTGTSDSIPAWLSNGEHVIRAASVNRLDRTVGPNFLNVLNATGDLDKAVSQARSSYARSAVNMSRSAYATGGRVEKMLSGMFEVNVQMPANTGTTVNQTFNTKVVRSNDDLYTAAPILHRNALAEARRYQR